MADDAYTTPPDTSAPAGTDATTTEPAPVWQPNERDKKIAGEVDRKFTAWRMLRQAHEPQWYMNVAFFRGNHEVRWSAADNRLVSLPDIQPQRSKRKINRLFAKVRARRAKFLKNRPTWVVVPATTDLKDKLDARATGKVLDYIWRKQQLERKYRDAIVWAESCARSYWWFSWDENAVGRVMTKDELTGQQTIQEGVVGDVVIECGSPFEVVVGDVGASSLSYADEIIRAKERTLDYVRSRYPERAHSVQAEPSGETFAVESQIAGLNTSSGIFGGSATSDLTGRKRDADGQPDTVVVKEYFRRPTGELPFGKYCVIANGILLKEEDRLPFGFYDLDNPFPCVEFIDVQSAGQYWGTTVLEQLIDPQREYNGIRTMISLQLKLMGHPKIFVAKQHQIKEGAWTPDAGEMIEYVARPGIPEPKVVTQAGISPDAWRSIELIRSELDDISQVYPVTEGNAGQTTSGFQTNLLQEAADTVHAPDVRGVELAIEEAAVKIRRIIKQGYETPRLITVTSQSYEPEVFEFSKDDVDEYADIIVQAGSALPMLKGARIQATLDLYAKGVLGDPADPNVRRRVLNVLDLGGMDDIVDYNRVDEDMINIENSEAEDGMELAKPRFFENHQAHWIGHVNRLKSPAVMHWQPEARMNLLAHAILHAMYINHAAAYQMSIEAGLPGLIPLPPPMTLPTVGGPPGAGGAAPPPGGGAQPTQSFNEAKPVTGGAPPTLAGGPNPNNTSSKSS